jgi:hypothetical protein
MTKALCTKITKYTNKNQTLKCIENKKEVQRLKCNWKQNIRTSKHKRHNIENRDEVLYQNTKKKARLKCLLLLKWNWKKFVCSFHQCAMDDNDNASIFLNHPFMLTFHHENTNIFGMTKKENNAWHWWQIDCSLCQILNTKFLAPYF